MARILTGIQSSGRPHLGNLLGAIIPGIELSRKPGNDSLFFIADLHSLTTIRDAELRRQNTLAVAAAWMAFGFDTDKNLLYRQSRIPEVTELTWYLSCFTPYPMLANSHAFKDKSDRLADVEPMALDPAAVLRDGAALEFSQLEYFFSGIAQLKQELLSFATRDARERAAQIAENTGSRVGKIISARSGVFQITEPYSTEVSGFGMHNTSTRQKEITVTVHASFALH